MMKRICALLLTLLIIAALAPFAYAATSSDMSSSGWNSLETGSSFSVWTKQDTSATPKNYAWTKESNSFKSGNSWKDPSFSKLAILCNSAGTLKFDFNLETENGKANFAYKKNADFTKASQVTSAEFSFTGDVAQTNNEVEVSAGDVVYFVYFKSDTSNNGPVDAVTISNIRLVNGGTLTVTSSDTTLGTVSWNLSSLSNLAAGTQVRVTATAKTGGAFGGWYETIGSTTNRVSTDASFTYTVTEDASLQALFYATAGGNASWKVGGTVYNTLTDALTAASSASDKTVVLARSGDLPSGNYIISSGVKVLIPCDASGTFYANPQVVACPGGSNYVRPDNPYATLTMASGAKITVDSGGVLSVCGKMASGSAGSIVSGAPTGNSARIVMNSGSSITVNGSLYAYGFITGSGTTGSGTVTANSGSTIHELFQITEHRGGSALYSFSSSGRPVFPITQYYVQNIEAPITYNYGCTETLHTDLYAGEQTNRCDNIPFIAQGDNSAILRLKAAGASITRSYDPATDRMTFATSGSVEVGEISLSLYSYTFTSKYYVLPIASNYTINVNSGNLNFAYDAELLPGAKVVVASGATMSVASGKKLAVYDSAEWVGKNYVYNNKDLVPLPYSPTRTGTRTLSDAELDVRGTVNVNGYLLTTAGGANIHGSNGGVINLNAGTKKDVDEISLYQATQSGTGISKTSISKTYAKLKNSDGSFTETGDKSTGSSYTYQSGEWNYVQPSNSDNPLREYTYKDVASMTPLTAFTVDGVQVATLSGNGYGNLEYLVSRNSGSTGGSFEDLLEYKFATSDGFINKNVNPYQSRSDWKVSTNGGTDTIVARPGQSNEQVSLYISAKEDVTFDLEYVLNNAVESSGDNTATTSGDHGYFVHLYRYGNYPYAGLGVETDWYHTKGASFEDHDNLDQQKFKLENKTVSDSKTVSLNKYDTILIFMKPKTLSVSDGQATKGGGYLATVNISDVHLTNPVSVEAMADNSSHGSVSIAKTAGGALSNGDIVSGGTEVTFTATPAAGYGFEGWYSGWVSENNKGTRVSNSASYAYTTSAADVENGVSLTAHFVQAYTRFTVDGVEVANLNANAAGELQYLIPRSSNVVGNHEDYLEYKMTRVGAYSDSDPSGNWRVEKGSSSDRIYAYPGADGERDVFYLSAKEDVQVYFEWYVKIAGVTDANNPTNTASTSGYNVIMYQYGDGSKFSKVTTDTFKRINSSNTEVDQTGTPYCARIKSFEDNSQEQLLLRGDYQTNTGCSQAGYNIRLSKNDTIVIIMSPKSENGNYDKYEARLVIGSVTPIGYTVSAVSENNSKGTVSITKTDSGTTLTNGNHVASGTSVTFTASPAAGYGFEGWYDGNTRISTGNPYTATITTDTNLTARFMEAYTRFTVDGMEVANLNANAAGELQYLIPCSSLDSEGRYGDYLEYKMTRVGAYSETDAYGSWKIEPHTNYDAVIAQPGIGGERVALYISAKEDVTVLFDWYLKFSEFDDVKNNVSSDGTIGGNFLMYQYGDGTNFQKGNNTFFTKPGSSTEVSGQPLFARTASFENNISQTLNLRTTNAQAQQTVQFKKNDTMVFIMSPAPANVGGGNYKAEFRVYSVTPDGYTVSAASEDDSKGTVSITKTDSGTTLASGYTVSSGTTVTFTAAPANACLAFDGWYDGETRVSNDASYTTTINADTSLTAKFADNHAYGAPVWSWAEGYTGATATFTCANDPSHTETVTATVANATAGNITTYTATVSFNGTTYTDTKRVMVVTATNYTGNYDGNGHSITLTAPEGATVKYGTAAGTYNQTTKPQYTNAGTYTVYYQVTGEGFENSPVTGSTTVTINPKTVSAPTITLSPETYTYDGTAKQPTVTVKDGTATIAAGEYTVSYSNNTNAGTATATITDKTGGNYTVSGSKNFTINKAALTVTAKPKTITYGDAPANDGVTYSGFVNSETSSVLSGTLAYDYTYSQYGNVGTYKITPKGLSSANYTITFAPGDLTVNQKTVGLTWGTSSFTYDGSSHAPTATATGLVNGDAVSVTVSGAQTDVGTYTATATALTGTKAGNYALPAAATQSYTINAAAINYTASGYSGTYDGSAHGITVTVTSPDGTTVKYRTAASGDFTLTENPAYTNAGSYTVYYQVTKANYSTATGSAIVTINKADPAYTVPTGLTATYGQTLADVTLPAGWTWNNTATSVGNVGTKSFKANFTPSDTTNYNTVTNVDVNVTVGKADQAAPTGLTVSHETIKGKNDGQISGVSTAMEYSTTQNGTYQAIASVPMSGLAAGDYYIRYSGDSNHNASNAVKVTVAQGKTLTVTWKNDNGETLKTDTGLSYGTTPSYDGATPTKAATAQYTYTFNGWDKVPAAITENTTYTATYTSTVNTYTVTWKTTDGTTLETDENVPYGATPSYDGATPTKAADAQYTYTFAGWTPTVGTVTGNVTYTAHFSSTVNKYTVTWQDEDGTTLETDANVAYGTTPSYDGATPTKAATAQYTYTFAGWTPTVEAVTGNVTYTATYTATVNTYTVTWKNENGTVLETDASVPYGTTPEYNGATPTKAATAQYSYTFAGWTPEVVPVTANAEYTASFVSTVNEYTVSWYDYNGSLIDTTSVRYGDKPTHDDPTMDDAQYSYTFVGWASEKEKDNGTPTENLNTVTEAVAYYAAFSKVLKQYTVSFVNEGETINEVTCVYGTSITSIKPTDPTKPSTVLEHYHFVGWRLNDAIVADNAIVEDNATYYAHYDVEPRTDYGTIKFEANAPAEASVVVSTMPDQYVTLGQSTFIAANQFEITGYTFHGWVGDNRKVYAPDNTIIINQTEETDRTIVLKAQWLKENEGATYTIRWIDGYLSEKNGVEECFREDELLSLEDFTQATAPSYLNKVFRGWSIFVDGYTILIEHQDGGSAINTADLLNNISPHTFENSHNIVLITAVYEDVSDTCTATAYFKLDGTVLNTETKTVKIGNNVRFTAPDIEGGAFSHWEYDSREIASREIIIRTSKNEVTLTAVYKTDASGIVIVEPQIVYVTDTFSEVENGVKKVAATLAYGNLPEGAEATEVGFIVSRTYSEVFTEGDSEHDTIGENGNLKGTVRAVSAPNSTSGTHTIHISSKSNTFGIWVRAFVKYRIGDETFTVLENEAYCLDWTDPTGDNDNG